MQTSYQSNNGSTFCLLSATLALAASSALADQPAGFTTTVKPYAVSSPDYVLKPILSVGDRVPLTSDSSKLFQMIGIPDGLGAYRIGCGNVGLYMNCEDAATALSEPVVGAARFRGAFVSRYILNGDAEVLSGEPAYDTIVDPAGNEVPPAREGNTTPPFVRLCSGSLAWLEAGFDRAIYFCGEENAAPGTFDGKGGLALAIFDHTAYTLPHLGHFSRENTLVRPHPTPETVMMLMEDGPAADSQLYMYVAQKNRSYGANPLERNGLTGGKFYVFAAQGVTSEVAFQTGSVAGNWVEITGVVDMNEAQLETAADAVGAFGFIKSEDGAWSKTDKNEFFFNATGDTATPPAPPAVAPAGNHLGRTYRLNLNKYDVTGLCTLTILYSADQIVAAGGDIALTPDNMDTSKEFLMVDEDGSGYSRTVMANKGRDGMIWRYDLKNNYAATPVVMLSTPGRDGVAVGPGVWETSGIVSTEHLFGRDSWLFDVQAHPPTAAPGTNTVEDGQLLLLMPAR